MTAPVRPSPQTPTVKAVAKPRDLFAGMNKTEAKRAVELEALSRKGVLSWRFEKVTLVLADDTRFTPDFLVINTLGGMCFEEVKGFWRDDAKVKIKVAAAQFPEFDFRSLVWNRDRNTWDIKNF